MSRFKCDHADNIVQILYLLKNGYSLITIRVFLFNIEKMQSISKRYQRDTKS